MSPELLDWLTRRDHAPVHGWGPDLAYEYLHTHPDLVERVTEVARPIRGTARIFVAGCPVIHHPSGTPIAAASGTSWFVVRSDRPAGALASDCPTEGLDASWLALDPWTVDVAFAKGIDLLRGHVARAFALAEAA